MKGPHYWRRVLGHAADIHRAAERGEVVITVPAKVAAQIKVDAYIKGVELAAEKWAARESEVTLPQWQATMNRAREGK